MYFPLAQNSTLRKPTPKSKKRLSTTGVPGGGELIRGRRLLKKEINQYVMRHGSRLVRISSSACIIFYHKLKAHATPEKR